MKNDTLLIIAIKVGNAKLVEWILSLDSLDATRTNARGLDALAVAKATDREHFLLGMALPSPTTGGTAATTEATAGTEGADSLPRPSAGTNSDEEIARLGNAIKMFKVRGYVGMWTRSTVERCINSWFKYLVFIAVGLRSFAELCSATEFDLVETRHIKSMHQCSSNWTTTAVNIDLA